MNSPGQDEVAMPVTTSLCMVNFNGERYLEETLGTAVSLGERFVEVLVVDDGSSDRSLEILGTRFPRVRVHALGANRGPAAARNAAYRAARGERVLFLDNDVRLEPSCPDRLLAALDRDPRAVAAMPSVRYAHDPETVQYDGAHNHFLGLMVLENADRPRSGLSRETREIDSLVTACFVIDRRRWGDEPPFEESFFIYQEDHDLGLRVRSRGGTLLSVPEAVCYHGEGTAGLSLRGGTGYSRRRAFLAIRNRWLILLRNYSSRSLVLLAPALACYELAQLFLVILRGWFVPWIRALAWTAGHLPEIHRARRRILRERRIPDRELMRGGPIPLVPSLTPDGFRRSAKRLLDSVVNAHWRLVGGLL